MVSLPLLILSGVIFPLNFLPYELQQYLLLNPIVHGLESLRSSFFSQYQPVKGVELSYLWDWALSLITLGLMLHIRFEMRLKAK
jgi:capsular polysaccharide transport system permease protein